MPAPADEAVVEDLRAIFKDEDGNLPDFQSLERARAHRLRTLLVALVVFFGLLAAAAWAGFFVFQPGAFRGEGVKVAVSTVGPLAAGDAATVRIRYANGERVVLGSFELTATLPEGFRMAEAVPPPIEGTRWLIGALGPGQSGEIEIRGTVEAGVGAPLAFSAYATYVPANFNSEFQAVGSTTALVEAATLRLGVSGPDRTPAGEPVTYLLRYENTGDEPLAGASVELSLPAEFLLESVSPERRVEDGRVPLPDLAPGQAGEITVRGSFASEASGQRTVSATAGVVAPDKRFLAYARTEARTEVVAGDLVLTAVTSGISGAGRINFGDVLRTTVTYENRGAVDLHGVEVTLVYEARPVRGETSPLILSELRAEPAGERDGSRVTWTRTEIARLDRLGPGDEGAVDVEVPLASAPFSLEERGYAVDVWAEAKVARVGDLDAGRAVKSAKTTLTLNSDLRFASRARYFNDDDIAVGTGPVPPRVGATTTYRISWTAENTLHELTGLTLRIPLPPGVAFGERINVSAGELRYDAASSTAVWTLNRMPPSVTRLDGEFDVRIVPTDADVGKVLPLTGAWTLEATDEAAGGLIVRTAGPLDTTLEGDPQVAGKGVVIR